MPARKWLVSLIVICSPIAGAMRSDASASPQPEQALSIDIPVKLEHANVVFDVGHPVLVGDMPFVLADLSFLAHDFKEGNTKGHIIAIFHGDAAYIILTDAAYNKARHVGTGNPYAQHIAGLMSQGVQIEMCGATAKANHWVNSDLLPGVKVNTDAMSRLTQLAQQGYSQIYE
jgi:intracellular sulfur oxidation DsrE/DsrF family protein